MIQDQSESNSERGKDKNFYLREEAGLTPLLGMTQSFEDCDWLVVQEGSKSAFKSRVYYKPSLWNYKRNFSCFTVLSLSRARTHTLYSLFTMLSYLTYFIKKWTATQYGSESAVTDPNHRCCIVAFFQLPNMLMQWLRPFLVLWHFCAVSGMLACL